MRRARSTALEPIQREVVMSSTSLFQGPNSTRAPDARTIRPDDGAVKLDGANQAGSPA